VRAANFAERLGVTGAVEVAHDVGTQQRQRPAAARARSTWPRAAAPLACSRAPEHVDHLSVRAHAGERLAAPALVDDAPEDAAEQRPVGQVLDEELREHLARVEPDELPARLGVVDAESPAREPGRERLTMLRRRDDADRLAVCEADGDEVGDAVAEVAVVLVD